MSLSSEAGRQDQIEILMLRDAQSKVVVPLIKLGQQQLAQDGQLSAPIALALSPLELSAQAGFDVDTVKRTTSQLRDRGYLSIHEERVEVPDLDNLRELDGLLGVKDQLRGPTRERSSS